MLRVAVDIGGTFTDLVVQGSDGRWRTAKVLSNPDDLVVSVLEALDSAAVTPADVSLFVHGTTAGLNAMLERRGARAALVTTSGFRDVYLIARGNRPEMYDLHYRKPPRLLDRASILEVSERMSAGGAVLRPVDAASVDRAAEVIRDRGCEVVAVCLLHAYQNPAHEQEVRELLARRLPDVPIVVSHEVAPEWREYERTATTVMSAYITPIMNRYLDRLRSALAERGLRVPLYITESNGGVMTSQMAARKAVLTLFSGPVGGVVGTRALGERLEIADLISADVGGTSFDVSLIRSGQLSLQPEFELQGLPILAPAVEVNSIGAGGGSLVYESAGRLHVGPQSAGANPGPAAYGRGGRLATVTDAHVVLGRLPGGTRLGGRLPLDVQAAHAALEAVGRPFGLGPVALAEQALELVHFRMAEAIREITVERGLHPRDFALCAFGGAGGLHATALADELEIDRVVIPWGAGAFSAWGMLQGSVRHDLVRTFYRSYGEAAAQAPPALEELRSRMAGILSAEGVAESDMRFGAAADLRYRGQEYALTLPLASWESIAGLDERFHAAYRTRYGHANPELALEFVALRVAGVAEFDRPGSGDGDADGRIGAAGPHSGSVRVRFDGRDVPTPVYERGRMARRLPGPAIVVEPTATTVIPPGWAGDVSAGGHLVLRRA